MDLLTFTFPFRQFYGKITHAQALGMSKSHHRQQRIILGNKDQLFLARSSVEGSTVHVAAEGAIGLLTGAGQEGTSSDGDEPPDDHQM